MPSPGGGSTDAGDFAEFSGIFPAYTRFSSWQPYLRAKNHDGIYLILSAIFMMVHLK